ncbi:MAG: hypothetical protein QM662_10685 [Gordonia sp. (in: high G+C Gram-positive bacteria)]
MKLGGVTSIQVADDTFVAAAPGLVAEVVGDRSRWRRWWPDLRLEVVEDRGRSGVRWRVHGPVTGTMEIWCEPVLDGVVLHYFLHGEPTATLPEGPRARADALAELNRRRRVAGKVMAFAVKDTAEGARAAGEPAAGQAGR